MGGCFNAIAGKVCPHRLKPLWIQVDQHEPRTTPHHADRTLGRRLGLFPMPPL